MPKDDEPSVTLPTSTVQHNNKLDLQILKKEPPDDDTRAAPWYQRLRIATLYSTVKSVAGLWRH